MKMKMIMRCSVSLYLSLALAACGSHTKGKDPLPLVPKTGTTTGGTVSPTVIQPRPPVGTLSPALVPSGPVDTTPLADIPVMGSAETLEIGTWNIEHYPKVPGSRTMVSKILNQLDVDVMAVEEINGEAAFRDLLTAMPKFDGVVSDKGQSQNVGVIYRKSDFTLITSEEIYLSESKAFPRPPLVVRLRPLQNTSADIVAIAVHLKAFGDLENQARRSEANILLERYVSDLKAKEPSLKIVILGDFNQPLLIDSEREVFNPWFNKAGSYTVATDILVQKGDYSYFAGLFSLIDHIITTNDFLLSEPTIVKLQHIVPNYQAHASDHLPVIARQRLAAPALLPVPLP